MISRSLLIVCCLFSTSAVAESFSNQLSEAAINRTTLNVRYDGSYYQLAYPNGDVPAHIGVCTDLVIRSYRQLGVDLQKLVHEDMRAAFTAYPSKRIWGLSKPDRNIDHRRVPNLQVFFERHGEKLAVTEQEQDYLAGDIVTWMLPGNLPHIGIVVEFNNRPWIVHNIGAGPKLEDVLFDYRITGHYRFQP